jgi:hypothetical protein
MYTCTSLYIQGPYTRLVNIPLNNYTTNEDPFLWQDKRGYYHLLMHHFTFWGVPFAANHAYSRDAITWLATTTYIISSLAMLCYAML